MYNNLRYSSKTFRNKASKISNVMSFADYIKRSSDDVGDCDCVIEVINKPHVITVNITDVDIFVFKRSDRCEGDEDVYVKKLTTALKSSDSVSIVSAEDGIRVKMCLTVNK